MREHLNPLSFNPNIKRVTSISGRELEKLGWKRIGSTYTKGEDCIIYDGTQWKLNGERVEFLEDLSIKTKQ